MNTQWLLSQLGKISRFKVTFFHTQLVFLESDLSLFCTKGDEPPAKLLDDLFLKTKAAPCIYWLPLSEEQVGLSLPNRCS